MHHAGEGWLAATNELVLMHIDLEARRSCPLPESALKTLTEIHHFQAALPMPPQTGRVIGLKRRSSA